jgi:hypothetical protein
MTPRINRTEKEEARKVSCVCPSLSKCISNRNKHLIYCLVIPVFSFTHSPTFVYHSHSKRRRRRRRRRQLYRHISICCALRISAVRPPWYSTSMRTLPNSMHLMNSNHLQKHSCSSHSFARGFDDFVVTWPPSTNNTTSINDDK